jgi:phosphoglucomutase
MLAELMARAAGEGKTLLDRLDELYLKYGYYEEDQLQVLFEGASGSAQRERVLESYQTNPPTRIAGKKVLSSRNFAKDKIIDPDGETISKEKLIIFDLEDGSCVAVRPSGTEPKIRYYFFAHAAVEGTLSETQKQVGSTIAELTAAIQSDIKNR